MICECISCHDEAAVEIVHADHGPMSVCDDHAEGQQRVIVDGGQLESPNSRIAELEETIEQVEESQKIIRETTVIPRIEELQEQVEETTQECADLKQNLDATQETVAELRAELEAIAGLADDQATNPEKRESDLRHILIRRAKARDGVVKMYWEEVQDAFADLGHGEVSRPLCYDAIEGLSDQAGFEKAKKTSPHGNRVKAIKVDLDTLRSSASCSDITTRQTGSAGDKPGTGVSE